MGALLSLNVKSALLGARSPERAADGDTCVFINLHAVSSMHLIYLFNTRLHIGSPIF